MLDFDVPSADGIRICHQINAKRHYLHEQAATAEAEKQHEHQQQVAVRRKEMKLTVRAYGTGFFPLFTAANTTQAPLSFLQ